MNSLKVILFLNESGLICLDTSITILTHGFNYCFLTLTNSNNSIQYQSFVCSEVVTSIAVIQN